MGLQGEPGAAVADLGVVIKAFAIHFMDYTVTALWQDTYMIFGVSQSKDTVL